MQISLSEFHFQQPLGVFEFTCLEKHCGEQRFKKSSNNIVGTEPSTKLKLDHIPELNRQYAKKCPPYTQLIVLDRLLQPYIPGYSNREALKTHREKENQNENNRH